MNSTHAWKSFDDTIGASYAQAVAIAPTLPIIISEFASNEYGDGGALKAAWIDKMFSELHPLKSSAYPHLRAITWFESDNTGYRYDSGSTPPVLTRFTADITRTESGGFPFVRGNGAEMFKITAP